LNWALRLPGWIVFGAVAGLIDPWLISVGIAAFKVMILVLEIGSGRRSRPVPRAETR
jgi:hypothetical protein